MKKDNNDVESGQGSDLMNNKKYLDYIHSVDLQLNSFLVRPVCSLIGKEVV